LKIELLNL